MAMALFLGNNLYLVVGLFDVSLRESRQTFF